MARRARYEEEYEGPGAGRRPRRRSGNEGIWLALGAAVVVGLVFLLIISGGSSGESEKDEAKKVLDRFLKAVLANQRDLAMKQVHLESMLVEYGPEMLKNRNQWTPDDRKKMELDLFRNLRLMLSDQLKMTSDTDIRRKILDRAEIKWDAYNDRVEFWWKTDAYDKVIAERKLRVEPEPWVARVSEIGDTWLVTTFGRVK
jgi:hypothetical protein